MAKDSESGYVKDWMDAIGRWLGFAGRPDEKVLTALISEKTAALAESLRFSAEQRTKLDSSFSRDELLAGVREVVLPKLTKLGAMGLLGEESAELLSNLDARILALLDANGSPEGTTEALHQENAELKERIERLYARYIKSDIHPETEHELREKIRALSSRVQDQHAQLDLAKKKLRTLLSCRELIQSLRVKVGLMESRLDYQTRLIDSLTADKPQHRELVLRIDGLLDENKQLKMELERQADLLEQLQKYLPPDTWRVVEELVRSNQTLRTSIEETDAELETVLAVPENRGSLAEYVDKLNEENLHLKSMRETRRSIDDFIRNQGKGDPATIVEELRRENQQLEMVSVSRKDQLEYYTAPHSDRPILKAYARLRDDHRRVFLENEMKDQLYRHQEDEKSRLIAQAREKTTLIQENQRMKSEMAVREREWDEMLTKIRRENRTLGLELSKVREIHRETVSEKEALAGELARLGSEHKLLLAQLEGLFSRRD